MIKNDFYRIKITKENNIVFLKDEEQDKAYEKMDNDYERYNYQYYSNKSDLKKIAFIAEIIGVEKNEFIKFPRLAVSLNGSIYNSIKRCRCQKYTTSGCYI